MIMAKTRLRKMPENCGKCALSRQNWTGERECAINRRLCPEERKSSGRFGYYKPSWCPLVERREAE